MEDGRISRLLSSQFAAEPTISYQVKIYTSDKLGAGTDASVYIVLHGQRKHGKKSELTCGPNDFNRCSFQSQYFTICKSSMWYHIDGSLHSEKFGI